MIDIVTKYNNYLNELGDLLKNSYYKSEYFIKNLGISEAAYYRKLREKKFTTEEVTKLTELLYPEEMILKALEESEEAFKRGEYDTHKNVTDRIRKKLQS